MHNKVLVVAAHPDDEVLGCGGTIAKHTHKNDTVQVCFLADGVNSRDLVAESLENRNKAAIKAAEILACEKPIFFDFRDNMLDTFPLLEIVKKIEDIINEIKPDIIYTHHFGDLNIDHQITHKAVITACRPQPSFFVREIYSFEILSATHWQSPSMGNCFIPNYFVSVDGFMEKKIKALECYDEEIRNFPHIRSYESVINLAKYRGSTVGHKNAESFCVERIVK